MIINRNYSHKRFGEVGSAEFVAPDGTFFLDGSVLPDASVRHLLTFALQTLQDAYAGAENADEAIAAFLKKREKLLDGTLGERTGTGVDAFTAVMRQVVRPIVKAKLGGAVWKTLSEPERIARIDAAFAKNDEKLRPLVEKEIADRAAKPKVDIDL